MFKPLIDFIREQFKTKDFIPLHEPRFLGNEKKYVNDCIDTTFVSSVGQYVDRFERDVAAYTGAGHAVAAVNGTAALHIALKVAGVREGDEVITQPLTFVATCNAIAYCGAHPVLVDVDRTTLGLSAEKLQEFLAENATLKDGFCYNKVTGRKISTLIPMHTFGHIGAVQEIAAVCDHFNITLIEDAAESLGSFVKTKHAGTFGKLGILSFNGNKVITTGGGGMIITDDPDLAKRAKHITTTAKIPHPYEYIHDEIGYNYRMPNINAALGCAQLEQIDVILVKKRELASLYKAFIQDLDFSFIEEPSGSRSNYWLNAVMFDDKNMRDAFLKETNDNGVMTRPIWQLMNKNNMFKKCFFGDLTNANWLEERVVNIPSSVKPD